MTGFAATKAEIAAKAAEIERTQGRDVAIAFYTRALVTPVNQEADRATGGAIGSVYGFGKAVLLGGLDLVAAAAGYRPAQERLADFARHPIKMFQDKYARTGATVARQLAEGDHFGVGFTTGEAVGPDAAALIGGGQLLSSRVSRMRSVMTAEEAVAAESGRSLGQRTRVLRESEHGRGAAPTPREEASSSQAVGEAAVPPPGPQQSVSPQPPGTPGAASRRLTSRREQYMGRTPGKASRTGREVIERMKAEGRVLEAEDGTLKIVCPEGGCSDISATDMSHLEDAVAWWNREGYRHGPKSEPVRDFMLDPNNYELESSTTNRSRGARTPERYRDPEPSQEPAQQPKREEGS